MPEPEVDPCKICGGEGKIRVKETDPRSLRNTFRPCVCLIVRRVEKFLGPELFMAAPLQNPSPLLQRSDGVLTLDRTSENLFVKAKWSDVLSHFKWALTVKFLADDNYRFRVTTDERILMIRLGTESYGQRSKARRDDMETYNQLQDYIGADFDLVLIRLGYLGHKNAAAPGYLKEALMLREVAMKPTWLLRPPSSPFGPGHFTYSDELAEYIEEHFDVVDFQSTDEGPLHGVEGAEREPKPTVLDDEESVALGASSSIEVDPKEAEIKPPRDAIQSNPEDLLGVTRAGGSKPGKHRRSGSSKRNNGRRGGGGNDDDGGGGGLGVGGM
jgi:hypothetical protein